MLIQTYMAKTINESFDEYSFGYYSQHHQMKASIYLWKGETRVATLDFINKDQAMPKNNYYSDPGSWGIYLYFEAERFNEVLTILQTEKTLRVWIELDNCVGGIVSSEHEPVGEQEL
jgi:antitoxin component YwqK of YwqJK toxin-antitoxin module